MHTKSNRRLAAIMFTDIQGYTALMQQDEDKGVAMRRRHREIFDSNTEQFGGEILQYYGDGTLSIFSSVVDAVACGIKMQLAFQEDPNVPVRVGIHLGDIVSTQNEIIGDAVNVASRIESMAVVGSVLISDRVQRDLKNHEEIQTQSLGTYMLKNVARPMEVFAISNAGLNIPRRDQVRGKVEPYAPQVEHNLPNPATNFIGRKKELQKITDLLEEYRLVTLYGPGGSGKTRLALAVAQQNLASYPDGVFFIDLAPLENPQMVAATFAQDLKVSKATDLTIEASIAQHITQKKILVLVDNCEHLIEASAVLIKSILANTILPKILVTSREVLNIRSELKYYVSTLTVPERPIALHEIDQYESLLLFKDRAQLNKPDFVFDEVTVGLAASICKRLDGIPLALELAAARVNILDLATILKRLDSQFKLLRSDDRSGVARQKTIRATLDWSHKLLTDHERLLFYRLSIFASDFDMEDVEAICSCDEIYEEDVIEILSHLADKSLVVIIEKRGKRRYRLLELMKEYGREKIGEVELSKLKDKYCQFYLNQVEQSYAEHVIKGLAWAEWLSLELDNIEQALEMLHNNAAMQVEMAGFLSWYWFFSGHDLLIGRKYLEDALEKYPKEDIHRGRALAGLGSVIGWYGGDLPLGLNLSREGVEILRRNQAAIDLFFSLFHLANMELFAKNYKHSEQFIQEGLIIAEKMGNPLGILRYKTLFGGNLCNQFLADEAEPIVKENLLESQQMNASFELDYNLHFYADIPMIRKEYREAAIRYLAGAQTGITHENMIIGIIDLQGVGMCFCGMGEHEIGLKIVGASIGKYEAIGAQLPNNGFWNVLLEQTVGKTMAALGSEKGNKWMAAGKGMKFEDAIAWADELVKNFNT